MGSLRIVFTVFLKAALVVGAVLGLFGCSAPAAVTVAGIAADGASYAASGKSLGDQALSIASGQNCSTLGMLKEGVLCHAGVAPALVDLRNEVPPFAAVPSAPAAPPLDNSEAVFLALGVFPDWENADHAVVLGRFYNPLIVPLDTDAKGKDSPSFWVVGGHPLAGGNGAVPIAQAKSIGFAEARTVVLCRATYRPAPCESDFSDNTAATVASTKAAVASKITAARRSSQSIAQRIER